jgi:hypothetical protein
MKNKKWLLVIVTIVFIFNIGIWSLTKFAKIDKLVQKKACKFLEKKLNADVEIGFFTFNDKQAGISDFSITENNKLYNIHIKQVYIEYNLPKLIYSRFKNLKAIKKITIIEPVLELNIHASNSKKTKKIKLPKFEKFFHELVITKGKLDLSYLSTKIEFSNSWDNFDLSLVNSKKSELELTAFDSNSKLTVSALLQNGEILKHKIIIKELHPNLLKITALDSIDAKINLNASYNKTDGLQYHGSFEDAFIKKSMIVASSPHIRWHGNKLKTIIDSEILFHNNQGIIQGEIDNIFKPYRTIKADVNFVDANPKALLKQLDGKILLHLKMSGAVFSPTIDYSVSAENLLAYDNKFSNLDLTGNIYFDKISFDLNKAYWQNNLITGNGIYNYKSGLTANLQSNDFTYNYDDFSLSGNVQNTLKYHKAFTSDMKIDNLKLSHSKFTLNDLSFTANMENSIIKAKLEKSSKDLDLDFNYDVKSDTLLAKLKLRKFDLNRYFDRIDLPSITGNLELSKFAENLIIDSHVRIYDKSFGKLDGIIATAAKINLKTKDIDFNFITNKTNFNYEPFSIEINAIGKLDSLRTSKFIVNDEIFLDAWFNTNDRLNYGIKVSANDLKLNNYTRYFMNSYSANQLKGFVDFSLEYNTEATNLIKGGISIDDFIFGESSPINTKLEIIGDFENLILSGIDLSHNEKDFFKLNGNISILPRLRANLGGHLENFDFSDIMQNSILKGKLNAELSYNLDTDRSILKFDIAGKDLTLSKQKIDKLQISATQHDSLLVIEKFDINTANKLELSGTGKLDYNILSNTTYADSNSFHLIFNGDLFKIISNEFDIITSGKSNSKFSLDVGISDNGFTIKKGNIAINNASLALANQLEIVDKVKIDMNFLDSKLDINDFKFRLGENKLVIHNEIKDENNFILGALNLGIIKVKTTKSGILVHIPKFMPSNSIANIKLSGRDSDNLIISGPFDDMKIIGDIMLSNGEAIFPPNTENLLKLINSVRKDNNDEKKKTIVEKETQDLPFSMDLTIKFGENVRYVTYPANLKISPNSFLHIKYQNGKLIIPEAVFTCVDGYADIFGTQMKTDFLEIKINEYQQGIQIIGNFYKEAADGTMITFEIFDANQDLNETNLQFQLLSDNSNDGVLDILSLLRYGRRVDDIAEAQKKTLLQDEVVSLIGVGLESALLDPLISPFENWIRSTLGLDFFYLSTDLVKNVVSNFTNDEEQQFMVNQETNKDVSSLNYDDFLNNFSINAGKYLTRKLFFDYEATIEKSYDIEYNSRLGVYQFFSLRYDLPRNFRVIYQYQIRPYEKDTHQITLQKSFKF